MYGYMYMGVIWGPMLASQPCLHAFWVLTSLHLLSFLLKMSFIILVCIRNSIDKYLPEFQSFQDLYFSNNYYYTDN